MIDPRVADAAPSRRLWRRFLVFGIAVIICVTALGVRLFQLTVADAGRYQSLAVEQQQGTQSVPVTRGLIYDRKGRKLVENVPIFVVRARPGEIPFPMRDAVVQRLAQLLDKPRADIYGAIDLSVGSPYDPVTIAEDVPTRVARVIAEEHLGLPGISVDVTARRHYLYGPLVAHIMGWTGRVSADEYQSLRGDGYLTDDVIGKQGVEATFETQLRGQYGVQQVQRDAAGRVVSVLKTLQDPVAGASLELTIDLGIQREAEKALKWGMQAAGLKRGVFIVMNPQNGEVLAMVSLPTYDDNVFADGVTQSEYRRLLKDPRKPLLNLGISEQLPPGSTFKLVTGLGALQDRKITPSTHLMTKGFITVAGTKMHDWNPFGFGSITIFNGFAHSSDTFFYQVALKLGIDRLGYWAHELGFGRKTGIDLPGETVGTVPTNEWKQRAFSQPIYPGETAQAGIGQGYDMVTAIQLITAYSALANGGTLYRPQLVRKLLDSKGHTDQDLQARSDPQAGGRLGHAAGHAGRGTQRPGQPAHLQLRGRAPGHRGQVRHRRVQRPGQSRPAAVPLLVRGLHTQGRPQEAGRLERLQGRPEHRLPARLPGFRVRLPDAWQRWHRDREVLPAAPLSRQEGLP